MWQNLQEALALVTLINLLRSKIIFRIENASFVIFDLLSSFKSGITIDCSLQFIDLLDKQKRRANMREIIQRLDKALNIGHLSLILNIQEKELLDIFEFGLLLKECLEELLILLQANIEKI